jgi:ribonuclease BN (tRNA processing enzyme)
LKEAHASLANVFNKRSAASDKCISGDTMPCEALENLGRSAELVIHEANFDDSMIELAKLKKHSTTRCFVSQSHAQRLIHKPTVAPSRAVFA